MADILESYVKGCRTPETFKLSGVFDDILANRIDNFEKPDLKRISLEQTKTGYRRYMSIKPRASTDDSWLSKESTTAARHFERYSPKHILETTMFTKIREVGYSVRCNSRLKQHANHSSSNYIMNLADAVFHTQRAIFPKSFGIEQFVIYLVWDGRQPEIAEIGSAKLALSYLKSSASGDVRCLLLLLTLYLPSPSTSPQRPSWPTRISYKIFNAYTTPPLQARNGQIKQLGQAKKALGEERAAHASTKTELAARDRELASRDRELVARSQQLSAANTTAKWQRR